MSVTLETGICAGAQESSFMNATLQSAGPRVAFSIATFVAVPADVIAGGEVAVAGYLNTLLARLATQEPALSFEVQVGPEDDSEARYIVGDGWEHIFHENGSPRATRFVFDLTTNGLVALEIYGNHRWQPASAAERADVEDSLKNANDEALENPEDWGLEAANTLPAWALAAE